MAEELKGYDAHFNAVNKWTEKSPEAQMSRAEVEHPDSKKVLRL